MGLHFDLKTIEKKSLALNGHHNIMYTRIIQ